MTTKTFIESGEINLLKKVFEDKTLRFSTPLNFNDPFEFRLPIKNLDPSESNDLNNLINTTFDKSQFHNIALDEILKDIGVLSLSSTNDNILMWSHYANNHKGIVLEFDKKHLFFYESSVDKKLIHGLEKVNYCINKPYPENIKEYFLNKNLYLTKHLNWKYEKEYRVTVTFDESNNSENKYNIKFPPSLIKAVYIGVNTENKDFEYILNLKQKKEWRHLNIYKFKINEKEYKLDLYLNRTKQAFK